MKGVDQVTMIVGIIIVMAVVIFAIALAAGALGPIGELTGQNTITNILQIFGITGGTK